MGKVAKPKIKEQISSIELFIFSHQIFTVFHLPDIASSCDSWVTLWLFPFISLRWKMSPELAPHSQFLQVFIIMRQACFLRWYTLAIGLSTYISAKSLWTLVLCVPSKSQIHLPLKRLHINIGTTTNQEEEFEMMKKEVKNAS